MNINSTIAKTYIFSNKKPTKYSQTDKTKNPTQNIAIGFPCNLIKSTYKTTAPKP